MQQTRGSTSPLSPPPCHAADPHASARRVHLEAVLVRAVEHLGDELAIRLGGVAAKHDAGDAAAQSPSLFHSSAVQSDYFTSLICPIRFFHSAHPSNQIISLRSSVQSDSFISLDVSKRLDAGIHAPLHTVSAVGGERLKTDESRRRQTWRCE